MRTSTLARNTEVIGLMSIDDIYIRLDVQLFLYALGVNWIVPSILHYIVRSRICKRMARYVVQEAGYLFSTLKQHNVQCVNR